MAYVDARQFAFIDEWLHDDAMVHLHAAVAQIVPRLSAFGAVSEQSAHRIGTADRRSEIDFFSGALRSGSGMRTSTVSVSSPMGL
jgi:hypothetical protein